MDEEKITNLDMIHELYAYLIKNCEDRDISISYNWPTFEVLFDGFTTIYEHTGETIIRISIPPKYSQTYYYDKAFRRASRKEIKLKLSDREIEEKSK